MPLGLLVLDGSLLRGEGRGCFVFEDMMETAAPLFGITVLNEKNESSCTVFLVNTLRPHFQKHLPWTRSGAAHQHG